MGDNNNEPPALLAILKTGETPEGVDYIKDYVGLWVHAPLEGKNQHVYKQKRKSDETLYPFAEVLYWQDDTDHWRSGLIECADPTSEEFGAGQWYFKVPAGPADRYANSYEVDGLTFTWNPSTEQQKQAEEEGAKAGEAEKERWAKLDAEALQDQGDECPASEKAYVVEDSATVLKDEIVWAAQTEAMEAGAADVEAEAKSNLEKTVLAKFEAWDTNGDKKISKEELIAVFKSIEAGFEDSDIDVMLSAVDADQDGHLNCQEFLKWVLKPGAPQSNENNADAGGDKSNTEKE